MIEHYHHTVQGWCDPSLETLYQEVVARAPDGATLVEVGVWKGKSLSYLLVEAANSRKNLRVVGVDHFRGSPGEPLLLMEARNRDVGIECLRNLDRAGYPFELLPLPSMEAARGFEDESLDFVFLDGCHEYEWVCADIFAWWRKLKPGGLLAGHDADYPQVLQAVRDCLTARSGVEPSIRGRCWSYEKPKEEGD